MKNQTKKASASELWNAIVELDLTVSDDDIDNLMDTLATYGVSIGGGMRNHSTITLSLPALDLVQAVTTAVSIVERATGAHAVGVEALPSDESDARSGLEPIPALASVAEAAELLGLSKIRVNQMITAGKFATARKVGNSFVIAYREVADLAGVRDPLAE